MSKCPPEAIERFERALLAYLHRKHPGHVFTVVVNPEASVPESAEPIDEEIA
jgi:hypothetical protein